MRRLTLEIPVSDIGKLVGHPSSLEKIESLEILNFLKADPEETVTICKIVLKDLSTKVKELFDGRMYNAQLLQEESKSKTRIYLVRRKPGTRPPGLNPVLKGGYLSTPYEIRDGRVKATFLGSAGEVRFILQFVERSGINYRVVSLTDARFSPSSPLGRLTEKQRKVLFKAYKLGYYDIPRRIRTGQLAKALQIKNTTLVMHRRKAERVLLRELLREL